MASAQLFASHAGLRSAAVSRPGPMRCPLRNAHGRRATVPLRSSSMETADYASNMSQDQYLVVGLAHCFEKNDEGKLQDLMLLEPINAPAMECLSFVIQQSTGSTQGVA